MSLDSGNPQAGGYVYSYVTGTVGTYSVQYHAVDGSGNYANPSSVITFSATATTTTSSSGGGGGTTTIIIEEGKSLPILTFGGITLVDFTVIATPRQVTKAVRFRNIGNSTFEKGRVFMQGPGTGYIQPYICDLSLQNCVTDGFIIKAGESRFLSLNGTFTDALGEGSTGVVRILEDKEKGVSHELNILISRPPLYKIAIKPLSEAFEIPELMALLIVYAGVFVSVIGGAWLLLN